MHQSEIKQIEFEFEFLVLNKVSVSFLQQMDLKNENKTEQLMGKESKRMMI